MQNKMIEKINLLKINGEKIVVLTCYDYEMSKVLEEVGVDIKLVGDSLGMVKMGYASTAAVTFNQMAVFTEAVKNGNINTLIVTDVPFLNAKMNLKDVLKECKKLISAGAQALKVEVPLFDKTISGAKNKTQMLEVVNILIKNKIPVMGHVGLTPQYVKEMNGYRVQGKDEASANKILDLALELQNMGVFSVLFECIPADLAKHITRTLKVPTIGIGAGPHCSGQVLVLDDILGLTSKGVPSFVKKYADLNGVIKNAVKKYCKDIKNARFPK